MNNIFEKLSRKKRKNTSATAEIPTRPVPKVEMQAEEPIPGQGEDCTFIQVGLAQSVGQLREHNEDALFSLNTTLCCNGNCQPFGLFIVADGMGGHQHGELASGIAARVMAGTIIRKLYLTTLVAQPVTPTESLLEILNSGISEANQAILKLVPGGGTTLTAVAILGQQAALAHVGDSRAYAIQRNGDLSVMTRDHSLVKRLVELGQITPEAAITHPQRNVLLRALGQSEPLEAEVKAFPVADMRAILLCSDGLWGVIDETEILEAVTKEASPTRACQRLVAAANAAGGPDNITAILVRFTD